MINDKKIDEQSLENVNGGYSERIIYSFNTGDVFISKLAQDTYLQVYDNYNDVKKDDLIEVALYFGVNSEPFHTQVEASLILNDFKYISDVLPW